MRGNICFQNILRSYSLVNSKKFSKRRNLGRWFTACVRNNAALGLRGGVQKRRRIFFRPQLIFTSNGTSWRILGRGTRTGPRTGSTRSRTASRPRLRRVALTSRTRFWRWRYTWLRHMSLLTRVAFTSEKQLKNSSHASCFDFRNATLMTIYFWCYLGVRWNSFIASSGKKEKTHAEWIFRQTIWIWFSHILWKQNWMFPQNVSPFQASFILPYSDRRVQHQLVPIKPFSFTVSDTHNWFFFRIFFFSTSESIVRQHTAGRKILKWIGSWKM